MRLNYQILILKKLDVLRRQTENFRNQHVQFEHSVGPVVRHSKVYAIGMNIQTNC
jgi:hypothetical protein